MTVSALLALDKLRRDLAGREDHAMLVGLYNLSTLTGAVLGWRDYLPNESRRLIVVSNAEIVETAELLIEEMRRWRAAAAQKSAGKLVRAKAKAKGAAA